MSQGSGWRLGSAVRGGPAMLGLSVPGPVGATPAGLPLTDYSDGDHGAVPWHPDSAMFWLIAFTAAAVGGIAGATVRTDIRRLERRGRGRRRHEEE